MIRPMTIFIYSTHDEEALHKKLMVQDVLQQEGFFITKTSEEANTILSIGGDGAYLQAVRQTGFRQDCLYIGISTAAKETLYCDFHYSNLYEMAHVLKQQKFSIRELPIIELQVGDRHPYYCLNEFSIRSNIIRMFAVDILIDDQLFETFLGDGLIISTPTGSTAYNKSVRGAVVDPNLRCLQVTELASVNSNQFRTLGSPFLLSSERKLKLHVHQDGNDFPLLATDNEALGIRRVEIIELQLSEKCIQTIELPTQTFWEKVQRIYL